VERLTINTALNDFVLIDTITSMNSDNFSGAQTFNDDPLFMGIESCAQLASMHVRHITDFSKHAFLLKVKYFSAQEEVLNGLYVITGKLLSHGSDSYSYKLCAKGGNDERFTAELIIGTTPYSEKLNQEELEAYYKKVFLCLQNA